MNLEKSGSFTNVGCISCAFCLTNSISPCPLSFWPVRKTFTALSLPSVSLAYRNCLTCYIRWEQRARSSQRAVRNKTVQLESPVRFVFHICLPSRYAECYKQPVVPFSLLPPPGVFLLFFGRVCKHVSSAQLSFLSQWLKAFAGTSVFQCYR